MGLILFGVDLALSAIWMGVYAALCAIVNIRCEDYSGGEDVVPVLSPGAIHDTSLGLDYRGSRRDQRKPSNSQAATGAQCHL